jgi:GT2 family glycosyltransferase
LLGLDKWPLHVYRKPKADGIQATGVVSGACLMARRAMFDQIGLLDERFFFSSEETDLCYRAHRAGWKIAHIPSARVIHICAGSTGVTPRRIFLLYQGKLLYFRKHYGFLASRILFASMQMVTRFKALLYGMVHPLSGGRIQKDQLWRSVANELQGLKP